MAPIAPGDKNMIAGGMNDGTNQSAIPVVEVREYVGAEKDHEFTRNKTMMYFIIRNGALDLSKGLNGITTNIKLKNYAKTGFFKKPDKIEIFGVNPNPITITVPVTVRLSDATTVDGTLTVDFQCDTSSEESINRLMSLTVDESVVTDVESFERYTRLNGNGLATMLSAFVADCGLDAFYQEDRVSDLRKIIRNGFYDKLFTEQAFSNKALKPGRASVRFGETQEETIIRLRTEGKIQLTEDSIKHDRKMMVIDFSKDEYEAMKG